VTCRKRHGAQSLVHVRANGAGIGKRHLPRVRGYRQAIPAAIRAFDDQVPVRHIAE
jgi:hypothetical protein